MTSLGTTPMMAQYLTMRKSLPADMILFFRLGDFYEMFFDDAKEAAPIMGVALTKRAGTPMCGVPYHSAQGYIAKLVQAGKRVAIAEQSSEPRPGKLVEREISRIITAGSIDDVSLLDEQRSNYLASVVYHKKQWGLAWVEHSTGSFQLASFDDQVSLRDELRRLDANEILFPDQQHEYWGDLEKAQAYDAYAFFLEHAEPLLCSHFKVHSLQGFGLDDQSAAIGAAGAILHYLTQQLRRPCDHLSRPEWLEQEDILKIDASSLRNLDLVESRAGKSHALLGTLDRTLTPMGARLLRNWVLRPLTKIEMIIQRQQIIAYWISDPILLSEVRELLKNIRDMERCLSRLSQGSGNARDLAALQSSLACLPIYFELVKQLPPSCQATLMQAWKNHEPMDFADLNQTLQQALNEELPLNIKDGGIIRDGWSAELDEIRTASRGGKDWIARLQESERQRTGIDSLKIKYNNIFGYFIEITSSNLGKVPEDYHRKQTMSNGERYITPALKEMENKVLGAEERSKQLEHELFLQLKQAVITQLPALKEAAAMIADVDALASLAQVALMNRYTCPVLTDSSDQILIIQQGRHPVLETTLKGSKVIPNDTMMNAESAMVHILTGPNMAGKSTYIRQVALMTIMAQLGSFVPADSMKLTLVDRIFCRIGASDDLSRGQSTFMVEMTETALILNQATSKSLVILDEIGRGTATFDGLSIAWAVAEHLHDVVACRTLFATHYHELTDLEKLKPAIANFHVAVREWNEEIIFLHQIAVGSADKSYGIQVARLAGLPTRVLHRAKDILCNLEMNAAQVKSSYPEKKAPYMNEAMPQSASPQLDLFFKS